MSDRSETGDKLRWEIFYDPLSGEFSRRNGRQVVFHRSSFGHLRFRAAGAPFLAHRVAWLLMTGDWPCGIIDHINGNPSDNRWANLRSASYSENAANAKRRVDNSSGLKGVSWHRGAQKWQARIKVAGKLLWLGAFNGREQAHDAYVDAAIQHFGQFMRAG